ncbi:MAG: rhomboid family intramembrane serine protease [Thermodesulfovibrionales bacterium]|nr:rhomboid family intramembrane serine protease [Thermodesulfovibrionales bacterium]
MLPVGTNLIIQKLPRVTLALIAINCLVFAVEAMLPEPTLISAFKIFGSGPSNWYYPFSPVTSMFLHGSVSHIVFNMAFLWIFGGPLEDRVGAGRYLAYYMGAGIAASLLSIITGFISYGADGPVGIGASGAISGVMGLYVYRCWYSKLRMVIDPLLMPVKFSIPAAPLMIFWFLKDVYFGIHTLSGVSTGVGHWAHVGGFVFGLVVARIMRYGHEGRVENLRQKIMDRLEQSGGWDVAEKELLALYKIAPKDPEVNHDLARMYANRDMPDKARGFFRRAVEEYFSSDPISAAYIVREHARTLNQPMAVAVHLRAAKAFVSMGLKEEAREVMLAAIKHKVESTPPYEKAITYFIILLWDMGRKDEAKKGWRIFNKRFPDSTLAPKIKAAVGKDPGTLFPVSAGPQSGEPEGRERASESGLMFMAYIMEIIVDPRFIASWMILSFAMVLFGMLGWLPKFIAGNLFGLAVQFMIFLLALVITLEERHRIIMSLFERISERNAEKTFDHTMARYKAVSAERNENFDEAAKHYEELLSEESDDLDARMSLAKVYHRHLNNPEEAARHYREIVCLLKPDSPMCAEAHEALSQLGFAAEEA